MKIISVYSRRFFCKRKLILYTVELATVNRIKFLKILYTVIMFTVYGIKFFKNLYTVESFTVNEIGIRL